MCLTQFYTRRTKGMSQPLMRNTKTKKKPAIHGTTSITFRIPKELRARLNEMAIREDLTVSQIIRRHFAAILPANGKGKEKP